MSSIFRPRAALVCALVASCSVLTATPAAASDVALKNAVLGSLLSYGYAWWQRGDLDCARQFRTVVQHGKDDELKATSLGLSYRDCNLGGEQRPLGAGFRLAPTVLVSKWSADAGPFADSAYEYTWVPRVQYVWPVGGMRVDAQFGIGVSYLSRANIGARQKATNFQFSDELGFGISDAAERVRLGFSYRHVSNADIRSPNQAVDFRGVSLTVRLH